MHNIENTLDLGAHRENTSEAPRTALQPPPRFKGLRTPLRAVRVDTDAMTAATGWALELKSMKNQSRTHVRENQLFSKI